MILKDVEIVKRATMEVTFDEVRALLEALVAAEYTTKRFFAVVKDSQWHLLKHFQAELEKILYAHETREHLKFSAVELRKNLDPDEREVLQEARLRSMFRYATKQSDGVLAKNAGTSQTVIPQPKKVFWTGFMVALGYFLGEFTYHNHPIIRKLIEHTSSEDEVGEETED
jgi:hypothetical protein